MLSIRLICFREDTGYGIASKTLYDHLKKIPNLISDLVEILPGPIDQGGICLSNLSEHAFGVDHTIIHTVPEYYPFWLEIEKRKSPSTMVWGYTTWETDILPSHWPAILNQLDGVFVPCRWNINIFRNSTVKVPIFCLPHISEHEGRATTVNSNFRLPDPAKNHFIFYTIGVWNERKSNSDLITAFLNEFSADEPVSLIVKTTMVDWTKHKRTWKRYFRKAFGRSETAFGKLTNGKNAENIHLITDSLSKDDIAALHQSCNCFISFTRGEGWGMGAFEAAWFGNSVAIPEYSGPTDFLSKDDTFWLDYRFVPVKTSFGRSSYSSNQKWMQVDILAAQKTMRSIFENQDLVAQRGKRLHSYLATHYSADTTVSILINTLREFNS